jgi:hypothetical protein
MFQRLSGKLVSGEVISLPVGRVGGAVRVCGELVHFGGSLVRVILHSLPSSRRTGRSMRSTQAASSIANMIRHRANVSDACRPASHEMDQKQYHAHYQGHVNERAGDMKCEESEQPKNNQNCGDYSKHVFISYVMCDFVRLDASA